MRQWIIVQIFPDSSTRLDRYKGVSEDLRNSLSMRMHT
jgi:hypothetical protein